MAQMIKRTLLIVATLACCSGFTVSQTASSTVDGNHKDKLAVLPFSLHGLSVEEGSLLTHRFAEVAAETGRFEIVLSDSAKGIEGTSELRFLANAGKLLGVQKVVHIDVVRREKLNVLRIRLVNVGDGALLYAERVDYSGDRDSLLSKIIPEQARKLSSAHLDAKTPWGKAAFLFGACLAAIVWIFWHFRRKGTAKPDSIAT
jgi:hypothetical protein